MNHIKGKRILITKSAEDCGIVFNDLVSMGAEIVYFPTIKIVPTYNSLDLTELISNSGQYDYVVFTSANAVAVFSNLVIEYKPDLSRTKVAVIGNGTAEACRSNGIFVHLIPGEFSAKGLLKRFSEKDIKGKKILVPCSSIAREELNIGLTELGADVNNLPIYDTVFADPAELVSELKFINEHKPDLFVFTSPSSFHGFKNILNIDSTHNYFSEKIICAIGTTTEDTIIKLGLTVNIVPDNFSLRGIAEAIKYYYSTTYNMV
ncbi:MAG: uroporphyrinogen-III synthase [Melioribacteraceae bacterium]|nr:uroporphyrinogen-III synthase [Melioribacteraceae bacterium]